MGKNKGENQLDKVGHTPFSQTYFHGTKADLKIGDHITIGLNSNYG